MFSASTSSVAFPQNSESKNSDQDEVSNATPVVLRPPHLPFRRISLPGISRISGNLISNRLSMASTTSLESTSVGEPSSAMSVSGESSKQAVSPRTRRRYTSSNHRLSRTTTISQETKEKRRKIVNEILSTEQAYVNGLDLIYTNFLTPLIESLDKEHPILSRSEITTLFSNFIDIWNFNRSFLTSLTNLLTNQDDPPQLSSVFMSHFPYLSLYTPFITSFPSVLTNLARLIDSNSTFSEFVRKQEADPRCGRLTLGDWLLTIVQRCPRYLLLLKDLISCTDPSDTEHRALLQVHVILSKITQSLNTSLHVHSQTISLLSLQRTIVNPPFQFVQPGRILIRRGSLFQSQTEKDPSAFREFLLFSDYLIWLALGDERLPDERLRRPILSRGRSRSETELLNPKKKHTSSEERWTCKGYIALVDIEVVIAPLEQDKSERARFDVLSPHISFAVYAATEDERELWVTEIRNAKATLLASLNTMLTNSTLTSSHATTHLRRVLQALPDEEDSGPSQKRNRVDHFLPAVWVPDSKTDCCMRCSLKFSWLKRRHHCRLCGRCVCADCSAKTFFISDASKKDTKRARSCNACYEAVFPVIQSSSDPKWKNLGEEARGGAETAPNLSKDVAINAIHADDTDIDDTLEDLPDFHSVADETAVRSPLLRILKPSVNPELFRDPRPRPLSQPVMAPIDVDVASDPFHIASLSDTPHTRIGRRLSVSKLQSSMPQLRHRVSSAALAVTPEIITANNVVSNTGLRGRRSSLALNGKRIAHMDPIQDDNSSIAEDTEYGQAIDKLGEILSREKI